MNINFFKQYLRYKKYQYLKEKKTLEVFEDPDFELLQNYLNILKKKGFVKIPNFLSQEMCNKTINIIDKFMDDYPNLTWRDQMNSDTRIFGAENISFELTSILKNFIDFSKRVGELYLKQKIGLYMIMANRTNFTKNNLGSGNGWHKDSYSKQFKSILYLKDVNNDNGPFQLIENSNKNMFMLKLFLKLKNKFPNTRFSEKEVSMLLSNRKNKIVDITGKTGTLILVDTSYLHRGKPLKENCRYALTNYFFSSDKFQNHKGHFEPKIEKMIGLKS